MKILFKSTIALFVSIIFISCDRDSIQNEIPNSESILHLNVENFNPCGEVTQVILWAGQNINAGTVFVENNLDSVRITFTTVPGWEIQKTHLFVGNCNEVPTNNAGNPQIGLFPYQNTHAPRVNTFKYTLSLDQLENCFCIAAHAELVKINNDGEIIQTETGWAEGSPIGGNSWATKINYCISECTTECEIELGDFRTQTQGGWGATPNGNNPGAFLHSNFDLIFPNGLQIGCQDNYSLTFTNAQAITNFLPQGGVPRSLNNSSLNPTSNLKNVLAGQLVALKLSIEFDSNIPEFGNSTFELRNLIIASGPFQGWTVERIFNEANLFLGGCQSNYSASELNAAITSINENFVDGNTFGNYLVCEY
jgi:hypothetical protein